MLPIQYMINKITKIQRTKVYKSFPKFHSMKRSHLDHDTQP